MNSKVEALVRAAGDKLRAGYSHYGAHQEKERYHLVTDLDGEMDDHLCTGLQELYPTEGIYSEESCELTSVSGDRWVIDPIDGTAYLIFGIPFFSISVARQSDGQVVEAHVFNPVSNEYFFADTQAGGSTLNGNRIQVSRTTEVCDSLLAFGFSVNPDQIQRYTREWGTVTRRMKKGLPQICPALSICNVARGRIDGYIDFGCSFEGQAAASLILENAGGSMRDYNDRDYFPETKGGVFTNGRLKIDH